MPRVAHPESYIRTWLNSRWDSGIPSIQIQVAEGYLSNSPPFSSMAWAALVQRFIKT